MSRPLSDDEIKVHLDDMDGWECRDDALHKRFTFPDFAAAIAFMARVAPAIDAANHHPEWTNVYNRIDVRCTTHDAGNKVTTKDVELAALLDTQAG